MANLITEDHVGKRLLIKQEGTFSEVQEATIVEIAPKSKHVKVNVVGYASKWYRKDYWEIVDVLSDLPPTEKRKG